MPRPRTLTDEQRKERNRANSLRCYYARVSDPAQRALLAARAAARRASDPTFKEKARAYRATAENKRKEFESHIKGCYAIDFETWSEMLCAQSGRCAICCDAFNPTLTREIHVDHSHATGVVRGLLCQRCNHLVGNSRDKPEVLALAIEYLKDRR